MTSPQTLIGAYLAAVATSDRLSTERYRSQLSRTKWFDAIEVIDPALRLAIKRCMGARPGFWAMSKVAVGTQARYRKAGVVARDVERIVRASIDKGEVALEALTLPNPELLKMLTFASLTQLHGLSQEDINDLIGAAEREAITSGFEPTRLER
ncbi:hypothetical protein [Micromonospora trifolii]|uniref:hypothetical protein n=1 Tax=Micromonospora trifolii TaxID=2911208 RepID=UPI003CF75476